MADVFYRILVGCLLWLSNWIRSDIAYVIFFVSQFLNDSGLLYWSAVKRILRYFKGTGGIEFL